MMHSHQILFAFLVFLITKLSFCQMPRSSRGTRPHHSRSQSELMNKVYCANCKVFILNPLNQADEKFLNFHYGSKGCCDQSLVYKKKDSVMVTFPPGSYFGMFDSHGDVPIFADD